MPTMLVEIAASRCPPVSGVLLRTGRASKPPLLIPQGSRSPIGSLVFCLLLVWWLQQTSQTAQRLNRSAGSPAVQARAGSAATNRRTERHQPQRVPFRWAGASARIAGTAIPYARRSEERRVGK